MPLNHVVLGGGHGLRRGGVGGHESIVLGPAVVGGVHLNHSLLLRLANAEHKHVALPLFDVGAGEEPRVPRRLFDRVRFARQRGFADRDAFRSVVDQEAVDHHLFAVPETKHVADHHLFRRDRHFFAAPNNPAGLRALLGLFERLKLVVFLLVRHRRHQHDDQDGNVNSHGFDPRGLGMLVRPVRRVVLASGAACRVLQDQRDGRCKEKHVKRVVLTGFPHQLQERFARHGRQHVRSENFTPLCKVLLVVRQAVHKVCLELGGNAVEALEIGFEFRLLQPRVFVLHHRQRGIGDGGARTGGGRGGCGEGAGPGREGEEEGEGERKSVVNK